MPRKVIAYYCNYCGFGSNFHTKSEIDEHEIKECDSPGNPINKKCPSCKWYNEGLYCDLRQTYDLKDDCNLWKKK
jgi:hypothetical protein